MVTEELLGLVIPTVFFLTVVVIVWLVMAFRHRSRQEVQATQDIGVEDVALLDPHPEAHGGQTAHGSLEVASVLGRLKRFRHVVQRLGLERHRLEDARDAEERPGAYILIGNGDTAMVHHPEYNFNDDAIPAGCSWWAGIVERRMPAT